MRIGLDLDGVICDWHKGVADVINSIWPARIPPGSEYPPEWELTSLGLSKAELGEVFQKIESFYNWYMGLPAIVRNVHAVWQHRIMRPEDEIFYVTARTTETKGLPIMHQSQRWLEMCGIAGLGTSVIVTDQPKIRVYEALDVQYAIDDCAEIVEQGPHVIYMLSQPWNREAENKLNVDTFDTLDEFFKEIRG